MKVIEAQLPVDHKQIKIYPLSDLHIGEKHTAEKEIHKYIEDIKNDPTAYVILNGDILNNATKTSISDIYTEQLDPNSAIDYMVNLISPIKDKVLAMTEGNHELRTYKKEGILLLYQAATRLGLFDRYSTGAYLLFISVGKYQNKDVVRQGKPRQNTYSIYGKHGAGGGRKPGAKAIRLEDMKMTCDADIFLHSHTHMPLSFREGFFRVDYQNKSMQEIDQLFVNTNAFMKHGGYGEEKGFSPASRKLPIILLDGTKKLAQVIM